MRGDSDDTRFAWSAVIAGVVWCLLLISGIIAAQGWIIGFCVGFVFSLVLLFLTLYKEWWPSGLPLKDIFRRL